MTTQSEQAAKNQLYFIHTPNESWDKDTLNELNEYFERIGFTESRDAAIGEGAGGPGWETVIEFVFNISAVASLTDQVWRITKYLKSKKPKKKSPTGKEIYRAVFHTNFGRIAVDLTSASEDLEVAINKNLSLKVKEGDLHVYDQSGKDWIGY